MQAVCGRAYGAALGILASAVKLASRSEGGDIDRNCLMTMLYPPGSSLDNNPLHVLCANDTCSFTWTGDNHINQVNKIAITCVTVCSFTWTGDNHINQVNNIAISRSLGST